MAYLRAQVLRKRVEETSHQSDWIVDDRLPSTQWTLVTKEPHQRNSHARDTQLCTGQQAPLLSCFLLQFR